MRSILRPLGLTVFSPLAVGIISLILIAGTSRAWAHKVTVFAWVEGNRVYTESQFAAGRKVRQGKIQVFDDKGRLLLEGVTDNQGAFAFDVPKVCDLKIVLKAGMGHQNQWTVPADEIREAAGQKPASPGQQPAAGENAVKPAAETAAVQDLSPQLEKRLEKILDRKLHPLVRQLAELQNRQPSLQDILGGIGYIIGLVGLGAYMRYRRLSGGGKN